MKKKALLSSILTIALCLSLIAGSTFALFTSESKVNVAVTAGKVDVVATVENLDLDTTLAKGNLEETSATTKDNIITLDKIVPGDYATFDIHIHNNSDVAVQYRTVITKVSDEGLWNGLVVTFDDVKYEGTNAVKTEWASMAVGCDDIIVKVKVALPEKAGNEYQHTSCSFAYTVEAVQGNAEVTSEWDGQTTTAITKNTEDGKYHITTAAELVWLMNESQSGGASRFSGEQIVLENNIDLNGATITGFGNEGCAFVGNFDGMNHSISNFTVNRDGKVYGGLFNYVLDGSTIKDLTVKNATIIAEAWVGAVTGSNYNGGIVENCHAINCTVIGEKKVGAVVGYNQNATVKNCSATDCTVYCEVSEDTESAGIKPQAGEVVGFSIKDGAKYDEGIIDCTSTNVTVTFNAKCVADGVMLNNGVYELYNEKGLEWFRDQVNEHYNGFNGKTVKLVADMDLNGAEWYPIGQNERITATMNEFYGIFDGNGHTIKNLNIKAHTPAEIRGGYSYSSEDNIVYGVGFFGWLSGAVKNVTFENVNVTGSHFVGVVAGYFQYTGSGDIIENCTVKNCKVNATHIDDTFCGDKAGGIVGMLGNTDATVKNCKVEDTEITAGRDAGQVVGCAQFGSDVENSTATNVTVTADSSCTDDNAGKNIKNDIIGRDLR